MSPMISILYLPPLCPSTFHLFLYFHCFSNDVLQVTNKLQELGTTVFHGGRLDPPSVCGQDNKLCQQDKVQQVNREAIIGAFSALSALLFIFGLSIIVWLVILC